MLLISTKILLWMHEICNMCLGTSVSVIWTYKNCKDLNFQNFSIGNFAKNQHIKCWPCISIYFMNYVFQLPGGWFTPKIISQLPLYLHTWNYFNSILGLRRNSNINSWIVYDIWLWLCSRGSEGPQPGGSPNLMKL